MSPKDNGVFGAGILVTAGGIVVTGDSSIIGSLGIGTATPAYQFEMVNAGNALMHLKSGITNWAGIYFGDTDLAARGRIYYDNSLESLSFSTSSSVRMTLDGSGNLGIGVVAPVYKLDVAGDIQIPNDKWYRGKNSGGTSIRLIGVVSSNVYMGAVDAAGGSVFIREDGADRMSFVDGNVGIGSIAPETKFHVEDGIITNDAGDFAITKFNSQGVAWSTVSTLPSLVFNGGSSARPEIAWIRGGNTYPEFAIRQHTTANAGGTIYSGNGTGVPTETMTFRLGNVGIGTDNPTAKLAVVPASGTAIKIERSGGEASIKASGTDTNMMIDSNGGVVGLNWYTSNDVTLCNGGGFVMIGSGSPTSALEVAGTIRGNTHFQSTTTTVMVSPISTGSVYLRPDGSGSSTAQAVFTTADVTLNVKTTIWGKLGINIAAPTSSFMVQIDNNDAYAAWSDFPTVMPATRVVYCTRDLGTYGSNDFQAIVLHAKGSAANNSYGIISVSSEGTLASSKMNFMLRGSSTSDYRTILTLMNDEMHWKGETSSSDVPIRIYQGSTQKFHIGFDDTNESFQINHGTSFSTGIGTYGFTILGSRNRVIVGRDYDSDSQISFQTSYDKGSATWVMVIGNAIDEAYAYGIRLASGLNTPTTTVCYTLHANDGNLGGVGTLEWNTTSGFRLVNSLSSKDFKKNIKKTKIKGVEKLKAVRPKNYKWKGRTPAEEIEIAAAGEDTIEIEGYIVEELEAVIPDAVSKYTDPYTGVEVKGYADTALIKYLHQAILELETRLAALETP